MTAGTDRLRQPLLGILRPLGLGDLCTAVPALRGLRAAFPMHRAVLAAPRWQEQLLGDLVDDVVDTRETGRPIAAFGGADVVVNLHGRGPGSTRRLLALPSHRLIAFAHRNVPETADHPRWRAGEHEVARWCRLLDESGVPADPSDLALPRPSPPIVVDPGVVVVHPGAAAAGRRWPAERFAAVARTLARRGHRVAVTGASGDRELGDRVAQLAGPGVRSIAGRTSPAELAAVVASAALVVVNDTGVAHLATSFATPSVVLFGPVPPSEWGPPRRSIHRALWKGGRSGDPHGARLDPALAAITVEDALAAVDDVLGAPA